MDEHDEQDGARLESGNESCKSCASMLHREAEQNAVTVMDQENDTLVYQLYCLTGEEIGGRDGLQPRENRCVRDHEAGCAQRAPTVVMRWFS